MKNKIFSTLALATLLSMTSCNKERVGINVGLGFQIAGILVNLNFSTGTGYYYPQSAYDSYMYGGTYPLTVAYVINPPADQTSIMVFDQNGIPVGTVSCTGGDWQYYNNYFQFLRHWDYNSGPCAVLVEWDQWQTSRAWHGNLR